MIVVSFANDTWRFRFGQCSVWIFARQCMVAPFCRWLLLLVLIPFILLLSYLVFSLTIFTKRRGRRRGRDKRSRRLGGNSSIIQFLIQLFRNLGASNDRGQENPYQQANCRTWKGQCGHMRCTNISPRGERTRISSKGKSLVGGLHFPQPKTNAGMVILFRLK